jgi:hypothetical protein
MKGVGGDRYTFTNQHTGQPLIVNNVWRVVQFFNSRLSALQTYLITKSGAEATEFAVDSSGSGEDVVSHRRSYVFLAIATEILSFQIKLPTKNEVWTATSDGTGTCPIFGRVRTNRLSFLWQISHG